MKQNLDVLQLAWKRVGAWIQVYVPDEHAEDEDVIIRIHESLETGSLVIDAIEEDLLSFDPKKAKLYEKVSSFVERSDA